MSSARHRGTKSDHHPSTRCICLWLRRLVPVSILATALASPANTRSEGIIFGGCHNSTELPQFVSALAELPEPPHRSNACRHTHAHGCADTPMACDQSDTTTDHALAGSSVLYMWHFLRGAGPVCAYLFSIATCLGIMIRWSGDCHAFRGVHCCALPCGTLAGTL